MNPENNDPASLYVDGRWVISLHATRDYIDLSEVKGGVLTAGFDVPWPDMSLVGQSCHVGHITLHTPDSLGCMGASSPDDPAYVA